MTLDINERQLSAALRNVPVPMLAHDETGRIRFISEALLRLTGYRREQIPTFRAWLELAYDDPDLVERVVAAHRQGYDLGEGSLPQGGEYRVRIADGSQRVWMFKAFSIGRDDQGVAVNVSMAVDVTSERATLHALARSEAILRQAIRVGGVGSFERDHRRRVTALSDELIEMHGLGFDQREESFERWYRRVLPEDRGRVVAYAEDLADPQAPAAIEYRIVRPSDGAVRIIAERHEPQRDAEGRVYACVGLQRDVTDARAAENMLRESEARLRMTLEAGEIGAFDWNLVTGELSWDARTRAIWGLDNDAPITIATFYAGLHPDDVEPLRETIARSHDAGGDGSYDAEYRVLNAKDGRVRHVSARGRTLFEHGRPARMMGVVVDVTKLREATAVLERDRAELERLVEARTRELAEAQSRLAYAQRMEALGQLAGGIAHDFNNVLQAIEAAADLIERRPEREHLPRYLRMAREATKRGASISRRLSSLSRRPELAPEPVDVARILEDVALTVRQNAPEGLRVDVDAAPGLPPALADRRQFETALLNLIANAREAMDQRGVVTLSARAQGARAALECAFAARLAPGDYVRVEVADGGRGMAPDVKERAVEPFFSTKPRGQGAGLGLSLARGFADQSGGALAIDSAPGQGARVAIWLPAATAAKASAPRLAGGRGRLMLVDDDPLVRELLGEQLRVAGYEVAAFADGRTALAGLDAGAEPDLLMTDFAMPGMNGAALGREARKRRPGLPVVLLTGYRSEAADALGEEDFALLGKPIDSETLVTRVAGLIKPG